MSTGRFFIATCAVIFLAAALPQANAAPAPSTPAAASQPAAPADISKIEIRPIRLADNFYVIDESEAAGGSVSLLIGPDGILMVDTGIAALAPKVEAAIKRLSGQPIRYVINTHMHVDETGGNEHFSRLGAAIIARDQVRAGMRQPKPLANGTPRKPAAPAALPSITYDGAMTLRFNHQDVQLIAVPRAHTDGDTIIFFPDSDVIVAGDILRPGSYPSMNRIDGGTLPGMLDALATLIGRAGPRTRIFTSHGAVVDRTAAIAQRDLILMVRDRVAALMARGMSGDEIVALTAQITSGYQVDPAHVHTLPERFVGDVYAELKTLQ